MNVFSKIMYVLLGVILAVAIFCISVGIGCAVNGLTFGQQIADWFGETAPVIENVAEAVSKTPIA